MSSESESGDEREAEERKQQQQKAKDKLLTMDPKEITYEMVARKLREIVLSRWEAGAACGRGGGAHVGLLQVANGPWAVAVWGLGWTAIRESWVKGPEHRARLLRGVPWRVPAAAQAACGGGGGLALWRISSGGSGLRPGRGGGGSSGGAGGSGGEVFDRAWQLFDGPNAPTAEMPWPHADGNMTGRKRVLQRQSPQWGAGESRGPGESQPLPIRGQQQRRTGEPPAAGVHARCGPPMDWAGGAEGPPMGRGWLMRDPSVGQRRRGCGSSQRACSRQQGGPEQLRSGRASPRVIAGASLPVVDRRGRDLRSCLGHSRWGVAIVAAMVQRRASGLARTHHGSRCLLVSRSRAGVGRRQPARCSQRQHAVGGSWEGEGRAARPFSAGGTGGMGPVLKEEHCSRGVLVFGAQPPAVAGSGRTLHFLEQTSYLKYRASLTIARS